MKKIAASALKVLLVVLFLGPAFMKLTANPMIVGSFENFGYAPWFMYFIGVAELLGALGIAFGGFINKQLPKLATAGLMVIMVGAIGSHLIFGDPLGAAVPAFVFLVLLAVYLRILRNAKSN